MGWKGTVRSLNAAGRASARATKKYQRGVERANRSIDRYLEAHEDEYQRDRLKLIKIEQLMQERPFSATGIVYVPETRQWQSKTFRNEQGKISWHIQIISESHATDFVPEKIEIGTLILNPVAICLSKWATYVAFAVEQSSSNTTKKPPKLLYKSDPRRNRIAIRYGGRECRALEGDLETPTHSAIGRIGIVAFPALAAVPPTISIEFYVDPQPVSILVRLLDSVAVAESIDNDKGLVAAFDEEMNAQFLELKRQADAARPKPRSGCMCCAVVAGLAIVTISLLLI